MNTAVKLEAIQTIRRIPREHQAEALTAISAELVDHDRATAVMACGTGKTLVALWQAERLNPKRVVVFVPSLALLRQTLLEWAENTSWGERFRYLCVCSDPKVSEGAGGDDIGTEDIGFPVMTDPAVVGSFLQLAPRPDSVSVVFCTYQSAAIVGQAIKPLGERGGFDVGVFDEAHKTTGEKGGLFGFSLSDENIAIKKRLFFTATPKHYKLGRRDADGEFAVASMDDEAVYGRVAYRLGFSEAATRGIIVPYKIIISVVDSAMVDNAILDKSQVLLDGTAVDAKTTAHQLALKHAINEHDLRRVITFHSRVNAAAAFAAEGPGGVTSHLPGFQPYHVSGKKGAAERDALMQAFAAAPRGIITNARCLTEGVDVPSVDMVALIEPRKSAIDIAQTAGRAMRPSPGKEFGYVMVPLFVEPQSGESIQDAIKRTGFAEVIQVLNGMREADEDLAAYIRSASNEHGRFGETNSAWLDRQIEIVGPTLHLADIRRAITTRVIEELGSTWDFMLGKLAEFHNAQGHSDVPTSDATLGTWVTAQRYSHRNGRLAEDRLAQLEELNFVWDAFSARWNQKLESLRNFKEKLGHCNVPSRYPEDQQLADWVSNQREFHRKGVLQKERAVRLETLGVVWLDQRWRNMLSAIADFKAKFGHFHVSRSYEIFGLAVWCTIQRTARKEGTLSADRVALLDSIGFPWDPLVDRWASMFEALKVRQTITGSCVITKSSNKALSEWCKTQRSMQRKGLLSTEKMMKLQSLGFRWAERTGSGNVESIENIVERTRQ